jgi:hypothetical protein
MRSMVAQTRATGTEGPKTPRRAGPRRYVIGDRWGVAFSQRCNGRALMDANGGA